LSTGSIIKEHGDKIKYPCHIVTVLYFLPAALNIYRMDLEKFVPI